MTNRTLVSVAALTAFVSYCFYRAGQARAARTEVKEDLRRWEGEGGNDPLVATPSPAPVPQSVPQPYPGSGSSSRH